MGNNNPSGSKVFARLSFVILIGSLVGLSGCLDIEEGSEEGILIIVSILPQKEFAERVGGEHVKVTAMVGEGQDPHGYEPRPSQLKDVAKADLYFTVGSGVEFENIWMETLIEQNGDMEIVDASVGIDMIALGEVGRENDHEEDGNGTRDGEGGNETNGDEDDHEGDGNETHEDDHVDENHEGSDPHIWNSPANAMIMVENLRDALMRIDPDHAEAYANNTREYLAELGSIHQQMKIGLGPHGGEKFLVYHPSFGYLAHEYDLTQIAIEDEGKEPTPAGVQAIIDQAKEENITTVFVSPQFDESNAETIAEEIGGTVVRIDPLGERYLENMGEVSKKLIDGFER